MDFLSYYSTYHISLVFNVYSVGQIFRFVCQFFSPQSNLLLFTLGLVDFELLLDSLNYSAVLFHNINCLILKFKILIHLEVTLP